MSGACGALGRVESSEKRKTSWAGGDAVNRIRAKACKVRLGGLKVPIEMWGHSVRAGIRSSELLTGVHGRAGGDVSA